MRASVVIPTYNRRRSVLAAVERLLRQDLPAGACEVLVICKSDGTAELLRPSFQGRIQILESNSHGPAAARNLGLRQARGEVVIFLDDDMEPEKGFVRSHLEAHAADSSSKVVVIGYSPPVLSEASTPLQRRTAQVYREFFAALRQAVQPENPAQLTAGNFSTKTEELRALGGFNETYVFARDDFELAARLLERGFQFRFCEAARANMHIHTTGDELIQRAAERAHNDARLAREFPWCVPHLPFQPGLAGPWGRLRWALVWAGSPALAPALAVLRKLAPENLSLLQAHYLACYGRGLRQELKHWGKFQRLRNPQP